MQVHSSSPASTREPVAARSVAAAHHSAQAQPSRDPKRDQNCVPKRTPRQLAIRGGKPRFGQPIHVGQPRLDDRSQFLDRVGDVLDRRWLTNHGNQVQEFETLIEQTLGVRHCVATCNGTAALMVAAMALGLKGEIVMPAFTFVGTAHAMRSLGLKPVFCDCDPSTGLIEVESAKACIGPRTSAIVGVHLWGLPCPVNELQTLADQTGVPLLYDGAHAFGCKFDGKAIGNFGAAEAFSFHATKYISAAEGGAVTTNSSSLAEAMRQIRNFGFDHTASVRRLGINAKMSELHAAMGNASLAELHRRLLLNYARYRQYERGLASIPGIRLLSLPHPETPNIAVNYQYIVIEVSASLTGCTRDDLMFALRAENVLARRYFAPGCHRVPPYSAEHHSKPALQNSDYLSSALLCLPTGGAASEGEVEEICELIRLIVAQARDNAAFHRAVTSRNRARIPINGPHLSNDGSRASSKMSDAL